MEMGRRDLRRGGGTNRFSKKQSGSGFSGKSKKVMLKKLGLANEVNSSDKDDKEKEMVSKFSPFDLENEVSTKKSRILKKTNGVDHASVPRKLRSAMKKRNLESVTRLSSSASKKLNRFKTGIESCKKDFIKKENLEMETRTKPDLMTKDEEEVAATLSGLAGMFQGTEALPDVEEAEIETSKVAEVDSSLVIEADPEVNVSVDTKQSDETALDQAENLQNSTGTVDFLDLLKQNSSVKVTETLDKKLDSSIQARTIETRALDTDKDYMSNGLELWPGVSSVHSGAHLVSKGLSSTKLPPWMGQASSSSSKNASFLSESLRVKPRKLKKCASHVYITRLIKLLQTSKNPLILNQNESRCSEMSEHGALDDFRSLKNSFKKVNSSGDHMNSPAKSYPNPNPNPNPQRFDIPRTQNQKQLPNMKQFSLYSSQKQSYDFLSLSSSTGNHQINTNDESAAPNQFPQYHHHHQTKTFPIPQQPENFHISAPYNTQISPATSSHQVQQQHHHSPYLATRFSNPYHAGSVAVLNHQQQQLLQKRLMAAQYRPNGNNQYNPILQQSKPPNLSLNLSSTTIQPIQRFSNVTQQQHRLMANAAAVMAMNHQNNNSRNYFPVVYEDTRTPLQLLCNEQ